MHAQVAATERKELERLREGQTRGAEERGRADAKVATLQQRLDRAEEKLTNEEARADAAERKVLRLSHAA